MNRRSAFQIDRLPYLLLFVLLMTGCERSVTPLVRGEPAPGFDLERLDGTWLQFPLSLRNKVVVIHFWADWCALCKQELHESESVYRESLEKGLVVLAINVQQSRETAEAFIADLGITYDVLLDRQGDVSRRYGVVGLPVSYVIDRNGDLYTRILGGSSPEQLQQIITELL